MVNINEHSLSLRLASAQKAWDEATNAYSRYPGHAEWEAFLAAKSQVLSLREQLQQPQHPHPSPQHQQQAPLQPRYDTSTHSMVITTTQKLSPTAATIIRLLQQQPDISYGDMMKQGQLTKDKLRHGLLKLIELGYIEKVKASQYRLIITPQFHRTETA